MYQNYDKSEMSCWSCVRIIVCRPCRNNTAPRTVVCAPKYVIQLLCIATNNMYTNSWSFYNIKVEGKKITLNQIASQYAKHNLLNHVLFTMSLQE